MRSDARCIATLLVALLSMVASGCQPYLMPSSAVDAYPKADQELIIKIWDTAGQERFRTLTHAFYKQANGVVVAFDVTNEESFKNVRKWMESIYEHADQNICKVMVGNKIDLEDERKISKKEGEDLAA